MSTWHDSGSADYSREALMGLPDIDWQDPQSKKQEPRFCANCGHRLAELNRGETCFRNCKPREQLFTDQMPLRPKKRRVSTHEASVYVRPIFALIIDIYGVDILKSEQRSHPLYTEAQHAAACVLFFYSHLQGPAIARKIKASLTSMHYCQTTGFTNLQKNSESRERISQLLEKWKQVYTEPR